MAENGLAPKGGDILIYQTEGGQTKIEVRLQGETLWLNQAGLTELYQTTKQNISLHIQNIYDEGELLEQATVKEDLTVQTEGGRQVSRQVKHYNLDMIIAVGYRIKSHIATRFRQWATQRLREYIVKGFVLDDERLVLDTGFSMLVYLTNQHLCLKIFSQRFIYRTFSTAPLSLFILRQNIFRYILNSFKNSFTLGRIY